jgi:hypothetical protein
LVFVTIFEEEFILLICLYTDPAHPFVYLFSNSIAEQQDRVTNDVGIGTTIVFMLKGKPLLKPKRFLKWYGEYRSVKNRPACVIRQRDISVHHISLDTHHDSSWFEFRIIILCTLQAHVLLSILYRLSVLLGNFSIFNGNSLHLHFSSDLISFLRTVLIS